MQPTALRHPFIRLVCADPPSAEPGPGPSPPALHRPARKLRKLGESCVPIVQKVGPKVTEKNQPGVRVALPKLMCGHRCFRLKEGEVLM